MATLLTIVGQRKFLEAEVTGKKVEFAEYALGDGIGVTEGQTSLTSEKFRHPINDLKVVEDGILIECHVPKEAEGFTIREVGLLDAKGDLIVVSDYPETDRLITEESDTLIIQVIVGISNTESATINVDASELMASQQSVNLALEESKRYTDAKVGDVDFSEIEGKIKKLETEDKRLHVLIAENTKALQAIDAEGLQEQGALAEERGLIAEERGEVARVKGNLAEASAEKADRASERADEVVKELESYGHAGVWQAGEYKKNQEVLHEGSTYRAVKDTTTEPPSSEWQLIARKGTDGKGSVVTVNGVSPNEGGDVDLGELATPDDVDSAVGKALEASKTYTDRQIEAIPEVDMSHLETKEDATKKLNEAKKYTDDEIKKIDIELKPATSNELGGVMVGRGLVANERGTLMLASEIEYEGTGAGTNKLLAGTLEQGFFGEVPSSDFIDAETLSFEAGVTQGRVQFNDTPWLKFALDGKILFRPKKAIRNSISYDHLEEKGLIKGDKTIEINGDTYKVRLMKALADEYEHAGGRFTGKTQYSEWNRTMLPIHEQARDKSWERPQYVEGDVPYFGIDYTDADLQAASGSGRSVWCQEYYNVESPYRMSRGNIGVSDAGIYESSEVLLIFGWAPVLELVREEAM